MSASVAISVVLPTRNEEMNIRRLLPQLQVLEPQPQIVVSDAGSTDQTRTIAREYGVKVINRAKGRGPQLNAGAMECIGEVILFLHADSILPPESYSGLLRTVRDNPEVDGGAFRFSLGKTNGLWPKIYEAVVSCRVSLCNLPYGDQGFFLRSCHWGEGNTFADWPLMEDVEWWERMRKRFYLHILPWPLITSARRFEERGYFLNALNNVWTLSRYKMGVSPVKLAKEYYR